MKSDVRNLAASVRARLQNIARARNQTFQEILQYYAIERFLYRLASSPYQHQFILKGAMLLLVWKVSARRQTKDIDFLGQTNNNNENIVEIFRETCIQQVEPDGIVFDPESVRGEMITEDAEYSGLRISFVGYLDRARIHMQLDIGFSDMVYPEPSEVQYPSILSTQELRLVAYTMESLIAEKLEAMTKLGLLNSRLKDFYDIWALSRQFQFNGDALCGAIELTFRTRGTKIEPSIIALQEEFSRNHDKLVQWKSFQRRNPSLDLGPLEPVISDLRKFLVPVLASIADGQKPPNKWTPEHGWQENP